MTKLVNAGNLAIWPVRTQQQVRNACPNAKFNLGYALACAWRFPGGEICWIVTVTTSSKPQDCRSNSSSVTRSRIATAGQAITAAR